MRFRGGRLLVGEVVETEGCTGDVQIPSGASHDDKIYVLLETSGDLPSLLVVSEDPARRSGKFGKHHVRLFEIMFSCTQREHS